MQRKLAVLATALVLIGSLFLSAADGEKGKGNLRYTITVSKFENEAGWSGQWDIGDAWGAIMTAALQESGKFIVLGEKDMRGEAMAEQDLATSGRTAGGKKAPKTGQMTPAQLLVKGAITHVQDSTTGGGGGLNFMGIRIGGSGTRPKSTSPSTSSTPHRPGQGLHQGGRQGRAAKAWIRLLRLGARRFDAATWPDSRRTTSARPRKTPSSRPSSS